MPVSRDGIMAFGAKLAGISRPQHLRTPSVRSTESSISNSLAKMVRHPMYCGSGHQQVLQYSVLLVLPRALALRAWALRRRSPGSRICARSIALVGVDTSVANTLHLVVAKRVRQTADSMRVDSTDTASVSRKVRRARRVVRNHSALRTRGAGHCAATSKAVSCVSTVYCLVLLCTAV